MYEMPKIRDPKEADPVAVLFEVKSFLEDLTQELESEICTQILAENICGAERINRQLARANKLLRALRANTQPMDGSGFV